MGLAVELADNPDTIVCDEVTSGLDPLSENSILDLLKKLSDERGKTFICIIHNLAKLDYFDKITVVYAGEVVFFGNLGELKEYFGIDSALSLYDTLEAFDISRWREKWRSSALAERARAEAAEWAGESGENPSDADAREARPTLFSQLKTLLSRRYRLFFRDYTYLLLTMGITFGFPLVVVIFSIGGLPQIESLALDRNLGALDELRQNLKMQMDAAYASTIATGLVLFQVVLLSLIGANNSAREIAGERALYEKERFAGCAVRVRAFEDNFHGVACAVSGRVDVHVRKARVRIPGVGGCAVRGNGGGVRCDDGGLPCVQLDFFVVRQGEFGVDIFGRLPASAFGHSARASRIAQMGVQAVHLGLLGLGGLHVVHARKQNLRRLRPHQARLGFHSVALSCALGDGRPDRDCACRRVLGVLAQKL